MYRRVAGESPHGDGSISMLERLLSWWQGKLFVLVPPRLRGDRLHHHHHPLRRRRHRAHRSRTPSPTFLQRLRGTGDARPDRLLGAVFLKGFGEAIGIAVGLVGGLPALNVVVIGRGAHAKSRTTRNLLRDWRVGARSRLRQPPADDRRRAPALPETGARASPASRPASLVMPLVKGEPSDTRQNPRGASATRASC